MTDEQDPLAEHHRAELFNFLWRSYADTVDGRRLSGDVEILAEAAERNDWAGSPEIGATIAALLRKAYVKDLERRSDSDAPETPRERALRDREIVDLAETLGASHATIAKIYGMDTGTVSKVIQRKRKRFKG